MGTRMYASGDQIEDVLIEKYGEKPVANYYKFEKWALDASIEDLQAIANSDEPERDYLVYEIRNQIQIYDAINSFGLFGWGRLKRETFEIIESAGLDLDAGSTRDPEIIKKLIVAQGIKTQIVLTELTWN
jgi:hypothetical protein